MSAFPATRLSILERLKSADHAVRDVAFDELVTGYWKPVYKYLRVRWDVAEEEARDLTQAFFAAAFEKRYLETFDPARARFRTFLRVCLDRFAHNERRAEHAARRGGGARTVPLDFPDAECELRHVAASQRDDVEHFFRQETIRALLARAVDHVRAELHAAGRDVVFRAFERYDLEPPPNVTYAMVADELDLPVTQVTNHLAQARRLFRAAVLGHLREITATDAEYRAEARELLGVEIA